MSKARRVSVRGVALVAVAASCVVAFAAHSAFAAAGEVTTVAGSGVFGSVDGAGAAAQFSPSVHGVVFDGVGNLYIADTFNSSIRRMDPAGVSVAVIPQGCVGVFPQWFLGFFSS